MILNQEICVSARQNMNLPAPIYGHHVENIVHYIDGEHPEMMQHLTNLVNEVENEIFSMEDKEIPSRVIGELVMNKLKDLDEVAYVRFASVYREFKDINTFMDELKTMLK